MVGSTRWLEEDELRIPLVVRESVCPERARGCHVGQGAGPATWAPNVHNALQQRIHLVAHLALGNKRLGTPSIRGRSSVVTP